ncbi:hypothetical protein Val02_33310 [Virgisporangium aliadipatigenens]|uniref:ZIP family zinc transporter n=1 Tax=Virgisporangium aliadipatigenens TaxID=741659 RepID=A0A8J3YM37_9ACTN|nr:ZIP family zinc transporter [Virgisporangium aliadipatigenens]GIJ46445.1 hypothetical protein Val02_33310 [Virgisporangium aliadipatigenens]
MPGWMQAGGWGLLAGSSLLIGALVGFFVNVPRRLVAAVMAFGAGVLISAVSFELVADAHERAGLPPVVLGAVAGALVYTSCNALLARRGARHRKRSTGQPAEDDAGGSGTAIALGALLDGVPESVVIGASLLAAAGGEAGVSIATVAAVFISNVPEGLSSAAGMKRARRTPGYVFGLWGGIALVSGAAAVVGFALPGGVGAAGLAGIMAFAAGAMLAMIADTMIPEAFDDARLYTGLVTVLGFLIAFAFSSR